VTPGVETPISREAAEAGKARKRHPGLRVALELVYVLPAVIIVGGLLLAPGIVAFVRSLYEWNPGYASPWVGLANYRALFESGQFRQVLGNQAVFLLGVPIFTVVPLLLALVLYEGVPGEGMFRTIFFFPSVLAPAIVGICFRTILAPDGMINSILNSVGLGALQRPWIDDATLVKPTLIGVLTWAGLGIGVVIFGASLSSLPREQLEAASLDGASWWQRTRYVALPSLRPTIVLWVAFQIVTIFVSVFGWIFVLTNGGPGYASTTMDFDIYQNALQFGFFGVAAAESVLLLLIVLIVIATGFVFSRRDERPPDDAVHP
jgi:ABC-type sugar transport system permease subunit